MIFSLKGTSIGFKNIASKIAYDLRLWNNVTQSLTTKNNQTSLPESQLKSNEDMWGFNSNDDVLEISLNEQLQDVKD